MAECRLVIIKRNGEDLNEQLLVPGTEWKIGKYVQTLFMFVTTMPTGWAHFCMRLFLFAVCSV